MGDGLNGMQAAIFPVASVGSPRYTTAPVSAVEPIPHTPMYSSIAAADAVTFGGVSFSLIESWAEGGPYGLRVLDDRFQCCLSYISESNGLLEG